MAGAPNSVVKSRTSANWSYRAASRTPVQDQFGSGGRQTQASGSARPWFIAAGALGGAAVVRSQLPAVGPLCPMRRLTGVPCPACGASESVVAMSRGDLAGAAVANPFVFLVVLAVLAAALVPVARRAISDGTRAAGRRPLWVLPVIAGAWWYQLHRFDLTG